MGFCSRGASGLVGHAMVLDGGQRYAVAVNARGVEITPGGAAAFIEDATRYSIFGRR